MQRRRLGRLICLFALLPWLCPQLARAEIRSPSQSPNHRPAAVMDIELNPAGGFFGQLVDTQGVPIAGTTVQVLIRGREAGVAITDEAGGFSFDGLRGGVHQVVVGEAVTYVRCWRNRTSPPAATAALLLVTDGQTVRGQHPISHLFSNHVTLGLALAAAIAIPIVINNSDKPKSSP